MYRIGFFLLLSVLCLARPISVDSLEVIVYDNEPVVIKTISEDDISSYYNDSDFVYEELAVEESAWKNFKNWLSDFFEQIFKKIFGSENGKDFFSALLEVLPYILFALFIYFVIWFFLKISSKGIIDTTSNPNIVYNTEEERIIKKEDIKQLIELAVSQKEYRKAVRYQYLNVLKNLINKELISWEIQKTNEDYSQELKSNLLTSEFNEITRIYEYTWYGEINIDAVMYQTIETSFSSINQSIVAHA